MKRSIPALIIMLLVGCAAQQGPTTDDAIGDFIALSELEQMDSIRTREQYGLSELTERYGILKTRKGFYLVEFQRCRELKFNNEVTPDIRYDRNVLRARFDTIRGCRIKKIYAIDEAGAEELKILAETRGADGG